MIDNLIIATRQQGKTTQLIEKCHLDKYSIIVCPNKEMCIITYNMAKEMGKPIPMPITFEEFIMHKFCETQLFSIIDNFYFDELQMSLQQISKGVSIDTVVFDVSHTRVIKLKE